MQEKWPATGSRNASPACRPGAPVRQSNDGNLDSFEVDLRRLRFALLARLKELATCAASRPDLPQNVTIAIAVEDHFRVRLFPGLQSVGQRDWAGLDTAEDKSARAGGRHRVVSRGKRRLADAEAERDVARNVCRVSRACHERERSDRGNPQALWRLVSHHTLPFRRFHHGRLPARHCIARAFAMRHGVSESGQTFGEVRRSRMMVASVSKHTVAVYSSSSTMGAAALFGSSDIETRTP